MTDRESTTLFPLRICSEISLRHSARCGSRSAQQVHSSFALYCGKNGKFTALAKKGAVTLLKNGETDSVAFVRRTPCNSNITARRIREGNLRSLFGAREK
jgi:hypothetical protein